MEHSYRWERFGQDPKVRSYKWEFLRRNKEYQKDFTSFANQFPEWIPRLGGPILPPPVLDPGALLFFKEKVDPAIVKIIKRWGIRDPVNPALYCGPSQSTPGMDPPHFYRPQQFEDGYEDKPELFEPPVRDCSTRSISMRQTPMELRFVNFQIDIAQPLESICAELEVRIEIAKSWYRFHIGELPDFRKRPRARLQEYDSYVKVWDLRQQNLTFEEIAFRLFPAEMNNLDNRRSMIKRVRTHFKKAQGER